MKLNNKLAKLAFSCSLLALMFSSGSEGKAGITEYNSNEICAIQSFSANNSVSDNELSEMRGGFIFSNGLKVDFGIAIRTMVDGIILSAMNINSDQLDKIDHNALQTIISVGNQKKNSAVSTPISVADGSGKIHTVSNNGKNVDVVLNNNGLNLGELKKLGEGIKKSVEEGVGATQQQQNSSDSNQALQTQQVEVGDVTIEPALIDVTTPNATVSDISGAVSAQQAAAAVTQEALANNNLPGVVTIIQNNLDNKLIQNLNIIDLQVSGLSNLRLTNLTPLINHQAVINNLR